MENTILITWFSEILVYLQHKQTMFILCLPCEMECIQTHSYLPIDNICQIHCIEILHKLLTFYCMIFSLWFVFLQDVLTPRFRNLKKKKKNPNQNKTPKLAKCIKVYVRYVFFPGYIYLQYISRNKTIIKMTSKHPNKDKHQKSNRLWIQTVEHLFQSMVIIASWVERQ